MPTLILSPRHTADSHALRRAAIDAGWEIERLSSWRVPEGFAPGDPALFGEWLFCEIVAGALGIRLLAPAQDALVQVPSELRRRDVTCLTLGEARSLAMPRFLKPAVEKSFEARVYQGGADFPDTDVWPEEFVVLAAEPVKWQVEFRCFVLYRRVVAISPYLRDGELAWDSEAGWITTDVERAEALSFAAKALSAVTIPDAVVMDIGLIEGRGWAIVEFNPANGSGLYGCDPAAVLPVLARACCSTR